MNLYRRPDLLQRLASAYALGTLRGGARRRMERLARQHADVRVAVLEWQHRLAGINELQDPLTPPPAVWARIERVVRAELAMRSSADLAYPVGGRTSAPAWWERLGLWRAATAAAVIALLGAVSVGVQQRSEDRRQLASLQTALTQAERAAADARAGRIAYVAVMTDTQGRRSGPEVLVTFDAQRQRLTLQRLGDYREADDKSLQLWALPAGGKPRSLGVLGRDALLRLDAADRELGDAPALAISLEPRGGVPSEGGPTGPVLFSGPVIRSQGL